MNENLLTLLQEKQKTFSKGRKILAKFITESYEEAAFMTAAQVGKIVGVSESTVVRFASDLGFDGYPGMQKAMQRLLHRKMSPDCQTDTNYYDNDAISKAFRSEMDSIRRTALSLDRNTFHKVVTSISTCHSIYIVGTGSDALLAEYFGNHLSLLFKNVHIITGLATSDLLNKLLFIDANDVIVGIDVAGFPAMLETAIRHCNAIDATTIAISNSKDSLLANNCDHVLLVKCEDSISAGSVVAPISLINALIRALSKDECNV